MADNNQKVGGANGSSWKDKTAAVTGGFVLAAFGVLILYLIGRTRVANENEWNRDVYIYGSLEAIAFAAAGFFFGNTVQRQATHNAENRAGRAEDRATESEQKAQQFEKDAVDGQALAAVVRAKAKGQAAKHQPYGSLVKPEDVVKATEAEFDELSQVCDELFPRKSQPG
jgi:hypothetical protein